MQIIKLDGCGFASLFDLASVDEDKRKNVEYFICINVCYNNCSLGNFITFFPNNSLLGIMGMEKT